MSVYMFVMSEYSIFYKRMMWNTQYNTLDAFQDFQSLLQMLKISYVMSWNFFLLKSHISLFDIFVISVGKCVEAFRRMQIRLYCVCVFHTCYTKRNKVNGKQQFAICCDLNVVFVIHYISQFSAKLLLTCTLKKNTTMKIGLQSCRRA